MDTMNIAKPDLIIFLVYKYDFLRYLKERIIHSNLDLRATQHHTCIPNLMASMPEKRSADQAVSTTLRADDPDQRSCWLSVAFQAPGTTARAHAECTSPGPGDPDRRADGRAGHPDRRADGRASADGCCTSSGNTR